MFDYIIVGAGYAGSILAERIATKLDKKVLIIEKRNHIAGNSYDFKDENNILLHKYGPHLFHTDDTEVYKYLSKFTNWKIYTHKVLAYIDGKTVPIPFNINTLYEVFPKLLADKLEKKLINNFKYNSKIPILNLKDTEDKDLQFLSKYIYDNLFLNYTAKQWNLKPEDIDASVTARVPILIGKNNNYFNDKYQLLPSNGYTELFKKMLNNNNIKLMLNTNFKEVCETTSYGFKLFGNEFKGKVIYTGQLDELFDYKFGELPYRSIDMKFEIVSKKFYQKATTVNYPNNYDFTRITEFKHMNPVNSKNTTILKEYPQEYKKNKNIPYYPILTDINQKSYNKYKKYSKNWKNLILVGRLAEYKYYDMDDITKRALDIFKEISI